MKDLFGNDIRDGDVVVFAANHYGNTDLKLGVIVDAAIPTVFSARYWYDGRWTYSAKIGALKRMDKMIVIDPDMMVREPHVKNAIEELKQKIANRK